MHQGRWTRFLLFACLLCASLMARIPCWADDSTRQSVVKIHATQRKPELLKPWTKGAPQEISGTGFVIAGNRILTNAHVVNYSSQVYVQPYQSDLKIAAKVTAIANTIDLAILTLEEDSFFADHPPLALDDAQPRPKMPVNIYGYPVGGEQLSVTEGIASRVEYGKYFFGFPGLRIQIDAALNPGNSGGPAISEGKVIGVAFGGLNNAENIGYVIPVEEVQQFLDDIEDGQYEGKPQLYLSLQPTENDALRESLRMPSDMGGMMVACSPDPAIAANFRDHPLRIGDVITRIGEFPIDRGGNVRLNDDLQVNFQYHIPQLSKDLRVPLTILRDGQTMALEVPVANRRERIIPILQGAYPEYFIVGPIVFSTASAELMSVLFNETRALRFLANRSSPLISRLNDPPSFQGEELVIIPSPYFSHPLTKGYSATSLRVVESVNGTKVKNLAHLVQLISDARDEFLEFAFVGNNDDRIVFPRQALLDSTDEILSDNGIRNQHSASLNGIWKQ